MFCWKFENTKSKEKLSPCDNTLYRLLEKYLNKGSNTIFMQKMTKTIKNKDSANYSLSRYLALIHQKNLGRFVNKKQQLLQV